MRIYVTLETNCTRMTFEIAHLNVEIGCRREYGLPSLESNMMTISCRLTTSSHSAIFSFAEVEVVLLKTEQ